MEDKLTNALIIFIFIIVIGLGGLYVYKAGGKDFIENIMDDQETSADLGTKDINQALIDKNVIQSGKENNINSTQIVIPNVNESVKSTTSNTIFTMTETLPPTASIYSNNNRYYYNQLDNYSKIIYDAIVDNIVDLKKGDCVIDINYDFSDLLNSEGGSQKLQEYYNDATNIINLDIPSLFYIDFTKMSLIIETSKTIFSTKYKLYISSGDNPNYFSSSFTSQTQVEDAINKLESMKKEVCNRVDKSSTYNKIRGSHDWIIEYLSYDGSSKNKGNIYGAFVEKKVVCEGYSRMYKYILDELGVENILVGGTGTNSNGDTEDHMWNYVKIDNTWYAVDITWDDPIVKGGGKLSQEAKHKYFLIGSDELFQNHVEKTKLSTTNKQFKVPIISKTKY